MRIKVNSVRFGRLMWYGTGTDKAGQRWRKGAKRDATRKDRRSNRAYIMEQF